MMKWGVGRDTDTLSDLETRKIRVQQNGRGGFGGTAVRGGEVGCQGIKLVRKDEYILDIHCRTLCLELTMLYCALKNLLGYI